MEEIDYYNLMLELRGLPGAELMSAIFEVAEPAVNDEDEEQRESST